ncbi:unnamed protein product (macronuclear) [Paramecium tetraurelia]|uniref:Golgi apparatus membrane protein TVP23 homolog n=1 Tax=Paramecium tetraurelia TaxID=5888 RepID=A0EFE4_PARTE|nr:uncharacterized protein GSPATT00026358001 [Paramecium tetraurelia]CAK94035.1 unnamed protein product [Paramecium tetraurelia]|eukprot:XP_001461408.1 hypothetical protein (macronuclear) [Paramecium tetraurelia strain d4-2]
MEQTSLDFNIDIQPKRITDHIEPDVDLTVDKYDSVYQNNQQEEEIEAANKDLLVQQYDITEAAHPFLCVAAVILTGLPGLCFIVLQDMSNTYMFVGLLQLVQFILMKNYFGLKLVGLCWWLEVKGKKWSVQTQSQEQSNQVDQYFFWACLVYGTIFWGIMCLGDLIGFKAIWLPLPIMCLLLTATNFQGFYKCRGDHKKKLQQLKREMAKSGLNIVGMIMK